MYLSSLSYYLLIDILMYLQVQYPTIRTTNFVLDRQTDRHKFGLPSDCLASSTRQDSIIGAIRQG